MADIRTSQVQKLQKSVNQREQQYLQVLDNSLPGSLRRLLENNFFTSIALYLLFFSLALVSSIVSKAADTDIGSDAKQLLSQAKDTFNDEKTKLTKDFSDTLEQAKSETQKRVSAAKEAAQEGLDSAKAEAQKSIDTARAEAQKAVEAANAEAQKAVEIAKAEAEKNAEETRQQLLEVRKELVRAQDEIMNRKADFEERTKLSKQASDEFQVHISDLHYQLAEKDKKMHALESAYRRLEEELTKEKEMHEASKEGLHDAIQKLIEAKKHAAHQTGV